MHLAWIKHLSKSRARGVISLFKQREYGKLRMKVLQILPELNSGGVERGTLEIASFLVSQGHESLVISNGGRLVPELEAAGSRHFTMPVHRKSLVSLLQVLPLRRLLEKEQPDILHIRSRVPGWIAWLAWKGIDPVTRPRLVSTVHGFYSVNRYSAVMTKGERVIAVSSSIKKYILQNYPQICADKIRVIHRGASPDEFPRDYKPNEEWLDLWQKKHPELMGKKILFLPGRITRWKGQQDFIHLVATLKKRGLSVHGLIAGDTHPKKRAFKTELQHLAASLGVANAISFLGHRSDVREVMSVSDIVFSLSRDPEAFGRVSLEAASLGRPVIGYNHGGVAEQLSVFFPQGIIPLDDAEALLSTTVRLLKNPQTPELVKAPFTQAAMTQAVIDVYHELIQASV
jgi:glycosyltransferase involved in cell wall biosynthesis